MSTKMIVAVLVLLMMTAHAQDWNYQGVPNQLVDDIEVDAEFLLDVNLALPGGKKVPDRHPEYLDEAKQKNIVLIEEAEVFVTFVHEGAGYRNSFGYFTYTADTIPQTPSEVQLIPIFANSSYRGSGGGLRTGHTVSLGTHPAGTHIGFWLKANAWNSRTQTIGNGYWTHYSLNHLNGEQDPAKRQHIASLWHASQEKLVLGFEDINREHGGCDQDFNDCIFFATASPSTAIDVSSVITLPTNQDEDNDGVPDSADLFPDDAERASVSYFPSQNTDALFCFEDNFPSKGDYDFNDMIIAARATEVLDSNQKLKEMTLNMELKAMGASYHNGFAIQVDVPPSEIESVSLKVNGHALTTRPIAESGHVNESVFLIMLDAFDHIDASDSFPNTINGQARVQGDKFELNVVFKTVRDNTSWPYNPFIYVNQVRGREVHLLNKKPTEKANLALFNTQDDKSKSEEDKYYRDINNMPWAMINSNDWEWPLEFIEITNSYPKFATWAQSSGSLEQSWFNNKEVPKIWRASEASMKSDSFEDGRQSAFWKTADLGSEQSTILEQHGRLYMTGAGSDIWGNANEYTARYSRVVGDFDVSVKIHYQENTHDWAKAGILLKSDMTQAATNKALVALTPNRGFAFQYDSNDNGLMDRNTNTGGQINSGYLRLVRNGNDISSYYKQSAEDSWTFLESQSFTELDNSLDLGLFISSHNSSLPCEVQFDDWIMN